MQAYAPLKIPIKLNLQNLHMAKSIAMPNCVAEKALRWLSKW
jgi:hypothetical protein